MTGVAQTSSHPWDSVSTGRAWSSLGLLSILYILSFIDRLILALLIDPVKQDLHVSDVQIGLLIGTSFAIVYSIAGLPIARWADVGNRKLLIFLGAIVWGISTAAAAFATSFNDLLLLRIGVAVGEAALTPAAMSLLSDMFPPSRRALPISIYVMVGVCGGSGAMIAGAAVLQLVSHIGADLPIIGGLAAWRLTLLLVGLPAILFALLIPFALPNPRRQALPPGEGAKARDILAHYRANAGAYTGFYIVTALISSVNFSILTWYPTHLIRSYGMVASDAGYLFGLFGVSASLVGGLLLPFVARRFVARGRFDGPMLIALAVGIISTPLLVIALLAHSATISMAVVIVPLILQIGLGILFASTAPLLAPGHIRGQLVALYYLVLTLVGLGIGPTLVAAIAEHVAFADGSISHALVGIILLFAPVQIVAILWTRRAFARTHAAAFASGQTSEAMAPS
ncbi:MFS transporter [uncultured Sphingobium sp.]|uniref:MFS transporter n=1 Tax=uncultured Sphingobium sp. TaxID=316087 RepID=UPI00259B8AC6|nr:MFS transporter [uncultured Sphingobium sp.]